MNKYKSDNFKDWLVLGKIKIMIPVSLTGFTGYFIFDPHLSLNMIVISAAILILAISASVLNQIQEIEQDSRMYRTQSRPLPSGRIKGSIALLFFLLTFTSGILILFIAGNFTAAIIGLITILWYNGIYTYLKRISAFAVVPGAVTGALPPLIGWVAAGGGVTDRAILFLGFLVFIGQIPHFWLLILKYGEDYKRAGFPSLTDIFKEQQIRRLTFTWVLSSVIAALFLCYFEIIQTGMIAALMVIASVLLVLGFIPLMKVRGPRMNYDRYSVLLNSYFMLVLILLISDRIIMT